MCALGAVFCRWCWTATAVFQHGEWSTVLSASWWWHSKKHLQKGRRWLPACRHSTKECENSVLKASTFNMIWIEVDFNTQQWPDFSVCTNYLSMPTSLSHSTWTVLLSLWYFDRTKSKSLMSYYHMFSVSSNTPTIKFGIMIPGYQNNLPAKSATVKWVILKVNMSLTPTLWNAVIKVKKYGV